MNILITLTLLCLAAVEITAYGKCVPQNGGYGKWIDAPCSVSCGKGKRTQHRFCDSPIPKHGGLTCAQQDKNAGHDKPQTKQIVDCDMGPCPDQAELGEYEKVGSCSKSCGGGTQLFRKKCKVPSNPSYTQCYRDCPADRHDKYEPCNTQDCRPEVGNECQLCKREAQIYAKKQGKPDFVGFACRTLPQACEGRKKENKEKGIKGMYMQNDWFFLHCAPDGAWCKPCATRGLVYNAECGNCEVKRKGVKCTDQGWDKSHDQYDDELNVDLW